jgi:radical SAM protein with 4Fe4S-binding SPASM domain
MNYQDENDILVNDFFYRHFFSHKFKEENHQKIEIYYNTICNLSCKYCYLEKYHNKLYPSYNKNTASKNYRILLDWISENEFEPILEIFSGEPLVQPIILDDIDYTLDMVKVNKLKVKGITIPTNSTFILNDKYFKRVKSLIKKGEEVGCRVFLSLSIDGKYCESNRPMKSGNELRDDKYYDKLFKFANEITAGFHPMIYSDKIDKWKDNFLWFQEMYKKYNIPWSNLYLLEVRNEEWTVEQINEYGEFLKFLLNWLYEKLEGDKTKFLDALFKHKGFNILTNTLSTVGRGLGCGIQSDISIRMNDLAIVPCHRTSYDFLIIGKFITKKDKIISIKSINPHMLIPTYGLDYKKSPYCETCPINTLCQLGCIGSQLESSGDIFTPIPTVCMLSFKKCFVIYEFLKEYNMLDMVKSKISQDTLRDLNNLEELYNGKSGI